MTIIKARTVAPAVQPRSYSYNLFLKIHLSSLLPPFAVLWPHANETLDTAECQSENRIYLTPKLPTALSLLSV